MCTQHSCISLAVLSQIALSFSSTTRFTFHLSELFQCNQNMLSLPKKEIFPELLLNMFPPRKDYISPSGLWEQFCTWLFSLKSSLFSFILQLIYSVIDVPLGFLKVFYFLLFVCQTFLYFQPCPPQILDCITNCKAVMPCNLNTFNT